MRYRRKYKYNPVDYAELMEQQRDEDRYGLSAMPLKPDFVTNAQYLKALQSYPPCEQAEVKELFIAHIEKAKAGIVNVTSLIANLEEIKSQVSRNKKWKGAKEYLLLLDELLTKARAV